MAGFVEVMRTARRMCNEMDECEVCPLYDGFNECCLLSDGSLCHMDSDFARYEEDIMKWAAENPEVRYPTWREWQQANFPNNSRPIHPCEFMRRIDKYCFNFLGLGGCGACANQPIPDDIARKLGIKPKEA